MNIASRLKLAAAFVVVGITAPGMAQAHPLASESLGLLAGFSHPLRGFDHVLAMVAVGLYAYQQGGRALWGLPLAFVVMMAAGAGLGMAGINPTNALTESGIAGSLLLFGLLLTLGRRLPFAVTAGLVGLFAIFHGLAHVEEMPQSVSALAYASGFVIATVLLHATGLGLADAFRTYRAAVLLRSSGAAVAGAGMAMWI
jgi:urease accessory protein